MKKDGNATSGGGEVKYGVRCKVFLIDLLSVQVFFVFFLTNMVVFLRFSIHFFSSHDNNGGLRQLVCIYFF
jgi:hypothetical protein